MTDKKRKNFSEKKLDTAFRIIDEAMHTHSELYEDAYPAEYIIPESTGIFTNKMGETVIRWTVADSAALRQLENIFQHFFGIERGAHSEKLNDDRYEIHFNASEAFQFQRICDAMDQYRPLLPIFNEAINAHFKLSIPNYGEVYILQECVSSSDAQALKERLSQEGVAGRVAPVEDAENVGVIIKAAAMENYLVREGLRKPIKAEIVPITQEKTSGQDR